MNNDQNDGANKRIFETNLKEVITEISANVQKKYQVIDLHKIPNHVNYAKVEKYLRSVNIEITRKMFLSYLKENLLPGGHEVKNNHFSYYTSDQIICYLLVDLFKPILPLNKVKMLFSDTLRPMIHEVGLGSTYITLCEMINYMIHRFEEAVSMVINEEQLKINEIGVKIPEETDDEKIKAQPNITRYTNLVTLCMAKGALDFYKYSPNTLLE